MRRRKSSTGEKYSALEPVLELYFLLAQKILIDIGSVACYRKAGGLNFEVTYPSAIILTKAPSIVDTTHTQQRSGGRPQILKHFQP